MARTPMEETPVTIKTARAVRHLTRPHVVKAPATSLIGSSGEPWWFWCPVTRTPSDTDDSNIRYRRYGSVIQAPDQDTALTFAARCNYHHSYEWAEHIHKAKARRVEFEKRTLFAQIMRENMLIASGEALQARMEWTEWKEAHPEHAKWSFANGLPVLRTFETDTVEVNDDGPMLGDFCD